MSSQAKLLKPIIIKEGMATFIFIFQLTEQSVPLKLSHLITDDFEWSAIHNGGANRDELFVSAYVQSQAQQEFSKRISIS